MQIELIRLLFRTLFVTKNNKLLLWMTSLASASIAIASMVCCLTIAIQNSFHKLLLDQLKISYQDARITPRHGHCFLNKHINYLNSLDGTITWAPATWKYVLVTNTHASFSNSEPHVAKIKFVHPQKECHFLLQHQKGKSKNVTEILSHGVIIGSELQNELGITENESIHLTFLEKQKQRKAFAIKPVVHAAIVSGFITTGIQEIDAALIICSYDVGKKFVPDLKVDEIALMIPEQQNSHYDIILNNIRNEFPELVIHSHKELYPTFFATLTLERYATWLYLLLLFLFVFMTQISLFLTQSIYNQKKIIILHFLGIRKKTIYFFTFFSIFVQTLIASSFGICIARIIAHWITMHTPTEIQAAYNIVHLPIELSAQLIIIIVTIMTSIAFVTACLTFIFLSQYNTMHTLKNET